ncbi:hypothetical protein [Hydrogenophaga sp. OTU3427]|uniref:hypothetical protein n=1 Tax=Hydrogenophaga sp. OTU3427 TaxID=3043856 RepID=UPI00313E6EF0
MAILRQQVPALLAGGLDCRRKARDGQVGRPPDTSSTRSIVSFMGETLIRWVFTRIGEATAVRLSSPLFGTSWRLAAAQHNKL